MNSLSPITFSQEIVSLVNYFSDRFFDFQNERGERKPLIVKSIEEETSNGAKTGIWFTIKKDLEYSDADIKCDIYKAISQFINENGVAEIQNPSEHLSWEKKVWDILCDPDSDYGYDFDVAWEDGGCDGMYV